jgi:hypothetical protein
LLDDGYRTPVLKSGESPEKVMRKSIYVKAFANSQSVFTGEPVMVTYKLYACIFSRSRVNRQPSFNGCSVMELSYSSDPDIEIIDGKTFHVFTIRKLQVIPLEDGPLHLGEVEIGNIVPFITADKQQDNFSMTSRNEPLIINVKPLPLTDKPKDFSGIVGSFTMQATVDSNNVPVGDNATLNITIKGRGNFTGIHVPAIKWPHGTEHFEVSDTQHIDQDNYPVEGDKTFSIPFIGSKEGKSIIGPVTFNFYDPSTSNYKTLTAEVAVTFTKAVSREEQMQDVVKEEVGNGKYLWIVAAIATVVIATFMISMQLKSRKQSLLANEKPAAALKQEPVVEQKDYGTEILSALNRLGIVEDDKKFLSAASYLLIASLQIKLGAPENTTTDELVILLNNHENTDLSKTCSKIFADCNRNLILPMQKKVLKKKFISS